MVWDLLLLVLLLRRLLSLRLALLLPLGLIRAIRHALGQCHTRPDSPSRSRKRPSPNTRHTSVPTTGHVRHRPATSIVPMHPRRERRVCGERPL